MSGWTAWKRLGGDTPLDTGSARYDEHPGEWGTDPEDPCRKRRQVFNVVTDMEGNRFGRLRWERRKRAEVVYVPKEPIEVGVYNGDSIYAFGYYRVSMDDGFVYLSSHTGFKGTVSEEPVALDINPEFVAMLVKDAEAARTRQPRGS